MSSTPSAPIASLQKIINRSAWRVWKGVGSFLLFEFGRRLRTESGFPRGSFTLWIYMATWSVMKGRREIAHSESPDGTIHRAADALTNKKLKGIYLRAFLGKGMTIHGARFVFEGGCTLQAWAYRKPKDDDDVFFMYLPGQILCYRHDGELTLSPMKEDDAKPTGLRKGNMEKEVRRKKLAAKRSR
jgi:hypothetical protein